MADKKLTASVPPFHATFYEAVRLHQAGRLGAAEKLYRQILSVDALHADSLCLLGMIALQVGHHDTAVELIGRAIDLDSTKPAYHNNLGYALEGQGKVDEALAAYDRAIALGPDFAEAHIYRKKGRTTRRGAGPVKPICRAPWCCSMQAMAIAPTYACRSALLG